ncbi:MAG TPA: AAA family ATPase [Vicinamibacteria bacterium]|nr:AAA family ATPase [Vicinamibacteria bacterium]
MYESFYGFAEKPFNLTPDPKYLYLSARHTEAYAHLEFGRRERGGFVVITGEVGTGKTTLARYFLSGLKDAATAVVLYPAVTAAELLRSILGDLHVKPRGKSLKELVDALHAFLLESRAQDRNVVLIIDEAQDLSTEVLEQIRLISNLETDTEKLIQIILMGQTELKELLDRRELRQLAQRVTARYHLAPLGRAETEEYVRHRLRVAGGEGKVAFSAGALSAVHRDSGGLPRLINLICDRALLAGYVQGTRSILPHMVRRAAAEVRGESGQRRLRPGLVAALVGTIALGAAWLLRGDLARPGAVAAATPPPSTLAAKPVEPSPVALDPLLLTVDRAASYRQAVADIEALWGTGPLVATPLRTHLEQVRRFDLPAALEMFHPSRRDTCFLALLRLEGGDAIVGDGRGGTQRVALPALDRLWTRQATLMWRDTIGVSGEDAARTFTFARESLGRLGYLAADGDFAAAVARFQQAAELTPDGVVGQRTLLALYSLGPHVRPRLSGGAS